MKAQLQQEWYSVEQCQMNVDKLYIFGDNTIGKGLGGQAQIRNCRNSFGIPTKMFPDMEEGSFFEDNQEPIDYIDDALIRLKKLLEISEYKIVIFPSDGLGTGLAQFDVRCPDAFNYLNVKINELFKQKIYEVDE